MPINIGQEMALPMEQIIGGPLQAVVKAQALAASSTVDFIQQVGLNPPPGGGGAQTARTVDFSFQRRVPAREDDDGPTDVLTTETVALTVPLLTIVPVPFIRVKEATVDFEAQVSSSTLNTTDSTFGISAEASGGFWGVKFSVKASYTRNTKTSDQVNRSSTLKVHVYAVQDEMPAGLDRVLTILQTAIDDGVEEPA
ncbi:DUF2589 domain-containing protein [Blastococcus brunescens]|uniref:DUF2589 domain-containing protein n=1 Tax=Blastococcus brunescens TaxID=1564165 RepID=A0ABZ1B8K3_9ACTN|nr:DUF2589 domain-containing protein [Blastococcus sp. BMG 8361]WRL66233.1 DUF2589 domain-containing protein [Blastococcus sp. BMG 8361]